MPSITEKLAVLRAAMKNHNIDAWIIPSSDAHESEYVAEHWDGRSWISGFDGSAGDVVITADKAALWTDGRYFLQGEQQLAGTGITLMKSGLPDVPEMDEWITENVKEQGSVGFDGNVMNQRFTRFLTRKLDTKKITLSTEHDLLDEIWTDRPDQPADPVFLHDDAYAGKTREEKLAETRQAMKTKQASQLLITTLDDIAWLFNLRGSDIDCNPVFLSYALISDTSVKLYIDDTRIEADALAALKNSSVELRPIWPLRQIWPNFRKRRSLCSIRTPPA